MSAIRKILLGLVLVWGVAACSENRKPAETETEPVVSETTPATPAEETGYADSAYSSARMVKGTDGSDLLQTKEISYNYIKLFTDTASSEPVDFLEKRVITTAKYINDGSQNRIIDVMLTPVAAGLKPLQLHHETDELTLKPRHYETISRSSYGNEDKITYYDYNSQHIIDGYNKILTATFPGSPLRLYVSFITNDDETDRINVGKLTVTYTNGQRYQVNIISDNLSGANKASLSVTPDFALAVTKADRFIASKNEYELTSWPNITSPDQLKNLEILIPIGANKQTVRVPLTNGKPFGKNDLQQDLYVNLNK